MVHLPLYMSLALSVHANNMNHMLANNIAALGGVPGGGGV